jgi:hypothetical protein
MKRTWVLLILVFCARLMYGQIVFRNDFIIGGKSGRLRNKGLTYITFNAGQRHTWNLNAYGQPVKSVVIDVKAIMARRTYTYQETIERLYRPGAVFKQAYIPIPLHLLLEPPPKIIKARFFSFRAPRIE